MDTKIKNSTFLSLVSSFRAVISIYLPVIISPPPPSFRIPHVINYLQPRGGGGYSPQILVGMCRGKVKNGGHRIELECENAGLRSELGELERENAGLWSELGELGRENAGLRN